MGHPILWWYSGLGHPPHLCVLAEHSVESIEHKTRMWICRPRCKHAGTLIFALEHENEDIGVLLPQALINSFLRQIGPASDKHYIELLDFKSCERVVVMFDGFRLVACSFQ